MQCVCLCMGCFCEWNHSLCGIFNTIQILKYFWSVASSNSNNNHYRLQNIGCLTAYIFVAFIVFNANLSHTFQNSLIVMQTMIIFVVVCALLWPTDYTFEREQCIAEAMKRLFGALSTITIANLPITSHIFGQYLIKYEFQHRHVHFWRMVKEIHFDGRQTSSPRRANRNKSEL